jgi:hypothetical protein
MAKKKNKKKGKEKQLERQEREIKQMLNKKIIEQTAYSSEVQRQC